MGGIDGGYALAADLLPALVCEVGGVLGHHREGCQVAREGSDAVHDQRNTVVRVAGGADDFALDAYVRQKSAALLGSDDGVALKLDLGVVVLWLGVPAHE